MLGKRKRDTQIVSKRKSEPKPNATQPGANIDADDIFRRYFEATFAPLPESDSDEEADTVVVDDEGSDEASEVSDWSGLSQSDDDLPVVEVVDYATTQNGQDADEFHRARQKAFMSSRPPREARDTDGTERTKPNTAGEDDLSEKVNLKHDLDLQRLLKESHLLEKSRTSTNPAKQRQMALDMRLQSLGAKQSLFTQQKMPAAHRVGITKKADQRQSKRRAEAKENGVILEKASKKAGTSKRRERGVDVPGVGKFAGGTLKLSRRDVASIQGSPAGRKGKKR